MSIILKRGTEANRSGLSLKTGEPIFTTDTRRLYIGSGSSSAGNEIEFGQLSASFVSASTISATNVTVDTLTAKNPINTTCSYSQTASYLLGSAESASYVDYANVGNKPSLVSSSAQFKSSDNVTFGQVTASVIEVQTLHVQTITSSVDYVTGSTIHGSQQSNTHQFTGSILATGSLFVNGHDIGTSAARTITGTANQITVTNGDGVAGNPTLSLPQDIATTSSPTFAGATINGNVGIGTATPARLLDVASNKIRFGVPSSSYIEIGNYSTNSQNLLIGNEDGDFSIYTGHLGSPNVHLFCISNSGSVGIGTNAPSAKLHVAGASRENGLFVTGDDSPALTLKAANGHDWEILASGNGNGVAAGALAFFDNTVAAYRLSLSAAGALRFHAYGAGTLVTDSSGNITATSDARMKDVSGSFDRGLDAIVNLSPKVYRWNKESGLNTEDVNVGLIAQEVLPYIPEAVGYKDDKYTMSDRPIISALINAVKELKADNDQLRARIEALES